MGDKIKCEICGAMFNAISWSHLSSHGIDIAQYVDKFPNSPLKSLESIAKKKAGSTKANALRKGVKRSAEVRDKISKTKQANPKQAWNKGSTMPIEQRQRLSAKKKELYSSGQIEHWNLGNKTSAETKAKISATALAANRQHSQESKDKRAVTIEQKKESGWKPWLQQEGGVEKMQQLMIDRYGTPHPMHVDQLVAKKQETTMQRYGAINVMHSAEIRKKIKQTNNNKYGVDNAMSSFDGWVKQHQSFSSLDLSADQLLEIYTKLRDPQWLRDQHYVERKTALQIGSELGVSYHAVTRALRACDLEVQNYFTSYNETQLVNIIKQSTQLEVLQGIRTIIKPLELDIVIPAKKVAIEMNGNYWHSELNGKDRNYHINKMKQANAAGYRLIQVLESEWAQNKEIVISRVLHAIGGQSTVVHARKCTVRRIDEQQAHQFISTAHIQGYVRAQYSYGIFDHTAQLVAVATFCRSRYDKDVEYELLRYCTLPGTSVIGGAGKALRTFIREVRPKTIVSYCDMRWGTGNLYKQLGFTYAGYSNPNYWYFKCSSPLSLMSRQQFQKHKLANLLETFDPDLTEWENMQLNQYDRIWDCGSTKWILTCHDDLK